MDNKLIKETLQVAITEIENGNSHIAKAKLEVLLDGFAQYPYRVMVDIGDVVEKIDQGRSSFVKDLMQMYCEKNGHDLEEMDGQQFCRICKWTDKPYQNQDLPI